MSAVTRILGLGALLAALAFAPATASRAQEPPPQPPPGGSGGGGANGGGGSEGLGGSTTTRGALPGGAPELAGYKDKVLFVLDRSGSMALADRFATALEIMDQLLHELPKDTRFDVYLTTETFVSIFKNEWYKPSADMRKSLKTRIGEAGGLDYGGFTDLAVAIKHAADKRRPDAIYVLSDGVTTIGDLETEKIVGAVVKACTAVKIPVHSIAIAPGQDVAEDATEAVKVLKGFSEGTGGIYREVKSELRAKRRAFLLWPPWAPLPAEDLARIHLRAMNGKELRQRMFGGKTGLPEVFVEIEDPALTLGSVAFEYAEPKLIVRTYLPNGKLFLESRPIGLRRGGDRFVSGVAIKIVGLMDESPPDEVTSGNVLSIKCPSGGAVDFVYKRGAREFRECATSGVADTATGK